MNQKSIDNQQQHVHSQVRKKRKHRTPIQKRYETLRSISYYFCSPFKQKANVQGETQRNERK